MIVQNIGEIISIIKFLKLLRIYGKNIQEVFSPQEKLRSLNHFYIVNSVISMLFTMSMIVMTILQGILMIFIHPMLLPLIKEWFL